MNNVDNELSNIRIELHKYYRGEDYGNEQDGYSKARTRQTMEAVEWALPRIIRAFFTGSSPVEFTPVGVEDIPGAAQDTSVVHNILRKTEFYSAIETWFRDSLIMPNGYLKVWWEDEMLYSPPSEYNGLTEAQVGMLEQNPEAFIQEVFVDERDGSLTVVARHMDRRGKLRISAVPPEEVLVDNDASCVDLDKALLVSHHRVVRKTDLVDMGYDPDVVAGLPSIITKLIVILMLMAMGLLSIVKS
jgi:hypothetical protein